MGKDVFAIEYDRDEYKRKMNLVSSQLKETDKKRISSESNEIILLDRIKDLEKLNISIRQMMTTQITSANEERQALLEKLASLQQLVKELQDVNKS